MGMRSTYEKTHATLFLEDISIRKHQFSSKFEYWFIISHHQSLILNSSSPCILAAIDENPHISFALYDD